MEENTRFVVEWIDRMGKKHGTTVRHVDGALLMDWGQALCYGRYGPNWDAIMKEKQITDPDSEAIRIAEDWEKGDLPDWMRT